MKKLFTIFAALLLVFTLSACKDDNNDAELVAEAKTALLLTDIDGLTADMSLPASGLHNSVITWASSNTDFITDAGVVIRPAVGEDNAVVTLTATITIGDESDTKEFTARVIAAVPSLDVTIAEFLSTDVSSGDIVEVSATVVGIVVGAGVQITDGTGYLYVYNGSGVMFGETAVAIGDDVVITGAKGSYYGSPQITDVTAITFVSAGNDVPDFVVTSIADLFAEDPYDTLFHSNPVTVTGVLELDGDDIYFIETDENNEAYRVLIYYKSDATKMADLTALEGKMVTADLFTYGYHDGYKAWRATINSTSVITSTVLTDAQQASYEVATINLGNLSELIDDVAVNGTTAQGSTITWSTSDAAVVTAAGEVTRVSGSDGIAVLTASVTIGSETATKDFDVVVKDSDYVPEGMSISDAIDEDDDEVLIVEGVVSNIIGSNTVLQDADGTAIVIYSSSFVADNGLALGDKIIVRGTKDTYYGVHQLGSVEVLTIVSSGNTVLTHTDVTVADIVADMEGYQGHNVVLTGLTVVELDNGFGYATVADDDGNEIVFKLSSIPYAEALWTVGDTVGFSAAVWDVYHDEFRVYIYAYAELTDQETVDYIAFEYYVTDIATADIDLDATDADTGVAIVWTSSDEATISLAGVVTQPAIGESEITVTLTATFTLNAATATETYTVTVPALVAAGPDVFFSEYVEGGYSNKAVELYNPTDAAIVLDGYVINMYSNGASEASTTLDLSGITIEAGAAYVICNAGFDATLIDTTCDYIINQVYPEASFVTNFNGDDAIELVKNGVTIDLIGIIGEQVEWTVGTGSTKDNTLVRVATVTGPNDTFNPAEWVVFDKDTLDQLGTHTID